MLSNIHTALVYLNTFAELECAHTTDVRYHVCMISQSLEKLVFLDILKIFLNETISARKL